MVTTRVCSILYGIATAAFAPGMICVVTYIYRNLSGLKRGRMNEHTMIHYEEEPLRRSKREKRLMFATLNVAQIDKQILNPGPTNHDLYLTDASLIVLCCCFCQAAK